jgi:hypothetical protein
VKVLKRNIFSNPRVKEQFFDFREDLVDEDGTDGQVEPQHYPDVEHARKVLLRKHPKHPVELIEGQLAAPEEVPEPDEVEPYEEVEDEEVQEARLGGSGEAGGELNADCRPQQS